MQLSSLAASDYREIVYGFDLLALYLWLHAGYVKRFTDELGEAAEAMKRQITTTPLGVN